MSSTRVEEMMGAVGSSRMGPSIMAFTIQGRPRGRKGGRGKGGEERERKGGRGKGGEERGERKGGRGKGEERERRGRWWIKKRLNQERQM
jgi:hypothetical protein